MSLQGMRKELTDLKREHAPGFKTIEELLKAGDIKTLTTQELFRLLKYYNPSLTTLENLTTEMLEAMATDKTR